jgi:hypothetical protein
VRLPFFRLESVAVPGSVTSHAAPTLVEVLVKHDEEPDPRPRRVGEHRAVRDRRIEVGGARRLEAGGAAVVRTLDDDHAVAAQVESGRAGELDELVAVVEQVTGDVVVVELVDPRQAELTAAHSGGAGVVQGAAVLVVAGVRVVAVDAGSRSVAGLVGAGVVVVRASRAVGLEVASGIAAISVRDVADVAVLPGVEDAVAAGLDRAVRATAVAVGDVAVVAVLARRLDAVAAGGERAVGSQPSPLVRFPSSHCSGAR